MNTCATITILRLSHQSCSHFTILAKNLTTGLVRALLNYMHRIKHLRLLTRFQTLSRKVISFCHFFVFVCCFIFRIRTSWVAFSLSLLRATNRICFKGVFSVPFYPKLWSATWKITVSGRFCYCLKSITFRNRFGFG